MGDKAIAKKLRAVRLALEEKRGKKFTQSEFGAPLGISQSLLSQMESGKRPISLAIQTALIYTHGLHKEYFTRDGVEMFYVTGSPSHSHQEEPTTRVPLLKENSSDDPMMVMSAHEEYIALPGIPSGGCALQMTTDAMAGKIRVGDVVIFDGAEESWDGDLVVIRDHYGHRTVRYFREKEGKCYYVSESPEYPVIPADDNWEVIGKVKEVWGRKL